MCIRKLLFCIFLSLFRLGGELAATTATAIVTARSVASAAEVVGGRTEITAHRDGLQLLFDISSLTHRVRACWIDDVVSRSSGDESQGGNTGGGRRSA